MRDYNLPCGNELHIQRYIRFISTRRPPNQLKGRLQGYERHHILPRSLGGLDNKENLIKLTPREHFIAHLILWKAYGREMSKAIWYMCNKKTYSSSLSSRQYEVLRLEQALESSRTNTSKCVGKKNPMYGKKHTEEWKARASEQFRGENNPNFGKKGNLGASWNWTEDQKENLRQRRAQQTPYSHDTCSGRKWVINRNTMHQCMVKPEELEVYKSQGYELGRISPPQPKRKKQNEGSL